ncbi:MAG: recombinase family protein [Rickettsiaceae bacterium]|nr:recombinase family protein [Rickettsiaceae bacterium]
MSEFHNKISSDHLKRNAYLYIRQSSLKQVALNTESTKRQYALKERAISLGWPIDSIIIIDNDLGISGAQAADREGFQRLVTEAGLGKAGMIMGLEVSRLARNSTDWHRLLEICALSNTLILDEDGIYDPAHFNDRLLLGLKGSMSEAELHILRARLRGGAINKAKRGELKVPLPVGYIYDAEDRVIKHPDKQVQASIHMLFKMFQELGSAWSVLRQFNKLGLQFPRQQRVGIDKGKIHWGSLTHSQTLRILTNPKYAGIYYYGRNRYSKTVNGKGVIKKIPKAQWIVNLVDSHESYISSQEHEDNLRQLAQNAQSYGQDRRQSPPREGPALLQGLIICGVCGHRMTIRYKARKTGEIYPIYVCQSAKIESGQKVCQVVPGAGIDEAISTLLLESLTPLTLGIALDVQEQLYARLEEANQLRKKRVERAQYEAELARQRYMNIDPKNRLVADTLEADWNEKLKTIAEAKEEYERQRVIDEQILTLEQKEQILALSSDFPKLWNNQKIPDREKKRMIRLLLEDVTITRKEQISLGIRFKGGATKLLSISLPLNPVTARKTNPKVVEEINNLLEYHYDIEIAHILNNRGFFTGDNVPFTSISIRRVRRAHKLKDYKTRLREKGMLNQQEMLKLLNTTPGNLKAWKDEKLIKTHAYGSSKNTILYEPPSRDFYSAIGACKLASCSEGASQKFESSQGV